MERSGHRRLVLMLASLAGMLAAVIATNWLVNPYGVWRTTVVPRAYRLTDAAVDQVGEHLSTPFRVRIERPSTILVGSSRVLRGMLVEQTGHDAFFNASLSGSSLDELAGVLRLATASPHLRRVIWGMEYYAFDEKFVGFRHLDIQRRLEADDRQALTLQFEETLFNSKAFRDSRRVLARAARGQRPPSLKDPVPWPEGLVQERLARLNRRGLAEARDPKIRDQLKDWIVSYVDYQLAPQQLDFFQNTVAALRRAGLEVVLFVPPLSDCELETIDQLGDWDSFQHWKRVLLSVGPYRDYSGYGKLDLFPELFTDVPHFKPAVGQVILRRALGLDCAGCGDKAQIVWDAGVWVDATTVDAYLAGQEAARAAVRPRNTRCTKVVERMLAARTASPSESP